MERGKDDKNILRREFRSVGLGETEDNPQGYLSVAVLCGSIHKSLFQRVTIEIKRGLTEHLH